MAELLRYYSTRLISLLVVIAAGVVLLDTIIEPWMATKLGSGHWLIELEKNLGGKLWPIAVLGAGAVIIRRYLWRLERPELDFSGVWEGVTRYQHIRIGTGEVPFEGRYKVRMDQDCLSIKIVPSTGESFVNWGSLALELPDQDTLRYAYWVSYSDRTKFPEDAVGYEEMRVTARDKRNRPIEMTGNFYHCARGQTPVYSGSVKFTRTDS